MSGNKFLFGVGRNSYLMAF